MAQGRREPTSGLGIWRTRKNDVRVKATEERERVFQGLWRERVSVWSREGKESVFQGRGMGYREIGCFRAEVREREY
jgi:hypothetical protein